MGEGSETETTKKVVNLLERTISKLEQMYEYFHRLQHSSESPQALRIEVLRIISGFGIRQLKIAAALIYIGWVPEYRMSVRALWEVVWDICFIMKHAGQKRIDLLKRYNAAVMTRAPEMV